MECKTRHVFRERCQECFESQVVKCVPDSITPPGPQPNQKPSVTWSVRKALQRDLVVWARRGGPRALRHSLDW